MISLGWVNQRVRKAAFPYVEHIQPHNTSDT